MAAAPFDALRESINNYSIGTAPFASTLKALQPHLDTLLDDFKAWAPDPEGYVAQVDKRHGYPLIVVATATLTRRSGIALPSWFLPHVKLAAFSTHDSTVSDLRDAFAGLDSALIVEAMHTAFTHDYFSERSAAAFVTLIEEPQSFGQMVRVIAEKLLPDNCARCLEHDIDRAMPILHAIHQENPSASSLNVLLRVANKRRSGDDDDAYLEGLGHKLKGLRELAQLGLSQRGGQARELLERGVKARKKAVREWCAAQLEALGDAPEELPELNAFEQLDEAAQHAMKERIDALYQKKPVTWNSWIKKEVSGAPMAWMHATLALFADNPDFIHRWAVFRTLLTHKETAAHHEQMWSVYLHDLARHPGLTSNHTRWHLKKHFGLIPGAYEDEVLEHALMGATAPMSIPMLEHYFDRCPYSPDMFVMSLKHKSKKVRNAALSSIHRWNEDTNAQPIVALLAERKKATRKYAAEALFKMPVKAVASHVEVLRTQLDKEKDEGVQGALTAAIARIEKA